MSVLERTMPLETTMMLDGEAALSIAKSWDSNQKYLLSSKGDMGGPKVRGRKGELGVRK